MDIQNHTTDDLLTLLPPDEDDRWEFKSADLLLASKKVEFKKELGKQVSAFANSGGGNLVIGISKTRTIEPCEQQVGRESMKDYLATMVEQSVEYPLRHFRVHRVPLTSDPAKSIFVIAIEDSPAAPHQAKDERNYYYRIDGHSKPAPHFHVELLRNRMTKAVLGIVSTDYTLQTPSESPGSWTFNFALRLTVENQSLQSASAWGVHVKCCQEDWRWKSKDDRHFTEGVCIHGEQLVLLPSERSIVTVHVSGTDRPTHNPMFLFEQFCVTLRTVSQNHVGEEQVFRFSRGETLRILDDLKRMSGR
jgi:hypothetical protein